MTLNNEKWLVIIIVIGNIKYNQEEEEKKMLMVEAASCNKECITIAYITVFLKPIGVPEANQLDCWISQLIKRHKAKPLHLPHFLSITLTFYYCSIHSTFTFTMFYLGYYLVFASKITKILMRNNCP